MTWSEHPMASRIRTATADPQPSRSGTVEFAITGMTCASCVGRVEKALRATAGVADAAVNLATSRATVTLSSAVQPLDLVRAVAGAGYEVPAETVELAVEGMTCASCVSRVEKTLGKVPGVTDAAGNLATARATVRTVGGVDPERQGGV